MSGTVGVSRVCPPKIPGYIGCAPSEIPGFAGVFGTFGPPGYARYAGYVGKPLEVPVVPTWKKAEIGQKYQENEDVPR